MKDITLDIKITQDVNEEEEKQEIFYFHWSDVISLISSFIIFILFMFYQDVFLCLSGIAVFISVFSSKWGHFTSIILAISSVLAMIFIKSHVSLSSLSYYAILILGIGIAIGIATSLSKKTNSLTIVGYILSYGLTIISAKYFAGDILSLIPLFIMVISVNFIVLTSITMIRSGYITF